MDGIVRILIIAAIILMASIIHAGSNVTLEWDANTEADLAGYTLHYGLVSGAYGESVDVGNATEYTVLNLANGTWYFAVKAYDDSGNVSGFSNEVSDTFDDTKPPENPQTVVIKIIIQIGVQ